MKRNVIFLRTPRGYKTISGSNGCKKHSGFTLTEVLTCLLLASLILAMGIPSFTATLERWSAEQGVRTVTVALATARLHAIKTNESVKCSVEKNRCMTLSRKNNGVWTPYLRLEAREGVEITGNASPVFNPTGLASPLCSIWIKTERHAYVATISMAGRVSVTEL